jgi:AGZA family xanthine/uracil permease-like MFS transporter
MDNVERRTTTAQNTTVQAIEKLFKLQAHGTTVRTELVAGLTTFLTMAYIVFVNPSILADAGMPRDAVFVATCLIAALGSLIMGLYANYPIALAPGMGLNSYFAYVVVKGMGFSWQVALGAVFISGCLFLVVTLFRLRELIIRGIPHALRSAITVGIGLFLAIIALKSAGIVAASPATFVTLGDLHSPSVVLAVLGFFLIAVLDRRRVPGAILIELFDATGTLMAVAKRAGLLKEGTMDRLNKALLADSGAIVAGSLLGTSSATAYIESAAGVQAGGRTGLTAVTVAVLFLACLLISPLAGTVPAYATAPALFFVACLMLREMTELDWDDSTEVIPAAVTALTMPFTYSIANGLAFGFITYAVLKGGTGRAREVHPMVWVIAAVFLFKFVYVGGH